MRDFGKSGTKLVAALALAGCMEGVTPRPDTAPDTAAAPAAIARDVEAPEVFDKTARGLWDGRPSLGGVWVAHPDVESPERVLIRNAESGAETVGALFRRERMNPGPAFQVSAEAAEAIGLLAGAPTELEVVALRERAAPEPAPDPAPAAGADPAADVDTAADPPPAPAADGAADDATVGAQPAPDDPSGDSGGAPEQRGFFARLFGRSPDAATGPPLDATVPDAAGAAAPDPETPAQAESALDRPFVQIGIFSVEDNATGARAQMQQAGLSARISAGRMQGNDFWRVTVGPAADAAERARILERVREMGFADAYPVRR